MVIVFNACQIKEGCSREIFEIELSQRNETE
jgi:hypothetical protein